MSERVQNWYDVTDAGDGITIISEDMGSEDVKSFLVEGDRDVAVLDTGMGVGDFAGLVHARSDRRPLVLQSHAHWDHIGASFRFERVRIHESEAQSLRLGLSNEEFAPKFGPGGIELDGLPADFHPQHAFIPGTEPSGWLAQGDEIDLGNRILDVYHTPGHTSGGITLFDRTTRTLFPGDAINLGRIYLFSESSDPARWYETVRLLRDLAAEASTIRPSHGPAITAEDVARIADAYVEVWSGREPDEQRTVDIGLEKPVDIDMFNFDGFSFLIEAGQYGSERG